MIWLTIVNVATLQNSYASKTLDINQDQAWSTPVCIHRCAIPYMPEGLL